MTQIDKIKAEIERHIAHYEKIDRNDFNGGELYICQELLSFIESLEKEQDVDLEKEQPKWDDSDMREDENELLSRFAFYTYKDEPDVLYLSNVFVEESFRNIGIGAKILKAAEKVAETIGAISIRLKVKQNSSANTWYRKNGYGYMTFEGDYDWLEKVLEYTKPVPKIKGWVAREPNGNLLFCREKPDKYEDGFYRTIRGEEFPIYDTIFNELGQEDEPVEVELEIHRV